jgi:hypothetical protein
MASFSERDGMWRAQVYRRGIRSSASFPTRDLAEAWAKNLEASIVGSPKGERIELSPREVFYLYNKCKERARERKIKFALTLSDVHYLYVKGGGRCALTKIAFNRFRPANSTKRPWFPSLDRIESHKPYTVENTRLVCVAVNIALGEWGDWVVNAIARAIVLGDAQAACNGPEATPYSFPAIVGQPTKRQERRRGNRTKTASATLTTHERADVSPLN